MVELVSWVVVGLLSAGAFTLFLRVRGLQVEVAAARVEAEKLKAELVATREQLTKSAAKQRRIAEESQAVRRKLDKARRRGAQSERAPGPSGARIPELEAELEQARQARDAAREEVHGLAAELKRVRGLVAEAPKEPAIPAPRLDNAAIEALQARLGSLEAELSAARSGEKERARAIERLKAKLRTQDELYVAMRGELAAKKDRLRTQQESIERLQALKVAFIDAAPAAADAAIAAGKPFEAVDDGAADDATDFSAPDQDAGKEVEAP